MCVTVMKILKKLEDNKAQIVYIKDYKRITLPVKDMFNMFREDGNVHISTIHLVGNNNQANVSIQNVITGKVQIHPMDAKAAGIDTEIKAIKYFNQTIIKDGKLNVNKITVIVDPKTARALNKVPGLVVKSGTTGNAIKMMLDLTVIPIAETKVTDMELLHIVKKVNQYSIDKKIIEYLLPKTINEAYNEAQKEMLNKYSISNGVYNGIDNKINPDNNQINTYTATEIRFIIKGIANIPSIKSVLTGKEPQSGIRKIIWDRYEELKTMSPLALEAMLKNINKELQYLKIRLMNVRIVKVNDGATSKIITNGADVMNIDIKTVTKTYA